MGTTLLDYYREKKRKNLVTLTSRRWLLTRRTPMVVSSSTPESASSCFVTGPDGVCGSGQQRVQGGEEGPALPDHAQDDLQHEEAGRPHEVLLLSLRRPQGRGARAAYLWRQLHQGEGDSETV